MSQFEIHLGIDLQAINYDGDAKALVVELCANDWCYFTSWDGTSAVVHSNYGKHVTSINEVVDLPSQTTANEA